MKRKLRSLAWLSLTVLPLPVQSVHELLLVALELLLVALLAGGIWLAHGVVLEFAEFFSDAAAAYCSYLRRQLNIVRRRDIEAGPP
jgi:hypothetical protein